MDCPDNIPSLLSLPRELRDEIYDYALEARAGFAYGPDWWTRPLLFPETPPFKHGMPMWLDEYCSMTDSNGYLNDNDHVWVLRSRLTMSAASLLRTCKIVAAEAEILLCRQETALFVEAFDDTAARTLKRPSAAFVRFLRRSRFMFRHLTNTIIEFLGNLAPFIRQHVSSILLYRETLDSDTTCSEQSDFQRQRDAPVPLLLKRKNQLEEYTPLTQALLSLPSLREVAFLVEGAIVPELLLTVELCHAVYWSRLERLHLYGYWADLYRMRMHLFPTLFTAAPLCDPFEDCPGHKKADRVPWLLEAHFSHAPMRCAVSAKSHIGLSMEADPPAVEEGIPPVCGFWTNFPEGEVVFTITQLNRSQVTRTMPQSDYQEHDEEEILYLLSALPMTNLVDMDSP